MQANNSRSLSTLLNGIMASERHFRPSHPLACFALSRRQREFESRRGYAKMPSDEDRFQGRVRVADSAPESPAHIRYTSAEAVVLAPFIASATTSSRSPTRCPYRP